MKDLYANLLRVARAEAYRWWQLGRGAEGPYWAADYCESQRTLWRARAADALNCLRREGA